MDFDFSIGTLRNGLIFFLVLVASLVIQLWAQAEMASRLGDDTPEREGRLTLYPLPHLDLFGSLIFPLVCIFMFPGTILFGWGKPMPLNPSNFRHRRRDEALVALAGPLANFAIVLLVVVVGGLAVRVSPRVAELVGVALSLNVALAMFNLIPLPPLAGGQLLRYVTNMSEEVYHGIARWSFLILIIAINLGPVRSVLGAAISVAATPFVLIFRLIAG